MHFRIADTFTDSLARLTADEQKATKTTVFDLQVNPKIPGLRLHKIDRAKDARFQSVSVNKDLRLIVHKSQDSLLLCYVDHHDKAYDWARRRKLETHPNTGAAQLVEIRERVEEVVVPVYVQTEIAVPETGAAPRRLFEGCTDGELLGYGVPEEWLADVRETTEAGLLALADHLPAEAAEALLELATGGKPRMAPPVAAGTNPFDHPDAQRRFRLMTNVEELERALEYPWEKWTVFLHPEQRQWVERDYSGPARVSGSAGTGKTVVALHRTAWLARTHPEARVLLTTFSGILANSLRTKMRHLLGDNPVLAERIDVRSLDELATNLYRAQGGRGSLVGGDTLATLIADAAAEVTGHGFRNRFLLAEWEQVVDAWQLESWEAYRDVARLGRKTRLPEARRKVLWEIFRRVRAGLESRGLMTQASVFTRLAATMERTGNAPYDFAVVDEAQDMGVAQLRFFAALGAGRADALFFAADPGQRIFQQPFSWKSLGVDVRGRSRTLRVNYRTSHQIRRQADRLLDPTVSDVDGNVDDRSDTVSAFNGPPPETRTFATEADESAAVGAWLRAVRDGGVRPHECGVFVRSEHQLERARDAVRAADLPFVVLDDRVESTPDHVVISTMHRAKGLEYRAVAVMACDDEVVPLQERIEMADDEGDLKETYETERHLLYVACTRARDLLLVTAVEPESEFLLDMNPPR